MKRARPQQATRLRPLLWRWHKYAGLIVGPFLVLSSVTGALLVFPEETERLLRPDLWVVPVGSQRVSEGRAVEVTRAAYPEHRVFSLRQPGRPDSPYYLWLVTPGPQRLLEVFVDPYTGAVLGDRVREDSFLRITEQLHRRLLSGKWGSVVIDLTTGWSIVLLVTGACLWWPRNTKQLKKGLTIDPNARPRQINWRLHNAVGAYAVVWVLLLAATGMLVSEVTGAMFRQLIVASEAAPKTIAGDHRSFPDETSRQLSIDSVILRVRQATGTSQPLNVRFPRDDAGVYLVSTEIEGHQLADYRLVALDQYTGDILAQDAWKELHPLTKTRSYGLAIHFGTLCGFPTKVLALVACLSVPALAVSGTLIWWWKRKSARATPRSAPRPARLASPPAWIWGIVVGFCLIFPTVGVSGVLIALGNYLRQLLQRRERSVVETV